MHPYSQSVSERQLVQWAWLLLTAALSIDVGGKFQSAIESYEIYSFFPDFFVAAVTRYLTPFGIFVTVYVAFDRVLWKWPVVRWLTRLEVPVLEGNWKVELKSSYRGQDGKQEPVVRQVKLSVAQTWSKIAIRLKTDQSSSDSYAASFILCSGQKPKLMYTYQNNPQYDNVGSMQIHRGTAELTVESECRLAGLYFTGRGRDGNYGTIELQRQ